LISSAAAIAPELTIGESFAGRFDSDMFEDCLAAVLGQDMTVDERLRCRLDGEGTLAVASGVNLAVDGSDSDAEKIGVGLCKLGNISGDLTVAQVLEAGVEARQIVVDRAGAGFSVCP